MTKPVIIRIPTSKGRDRLVFLSTLMTDPRLHYHTSKALIEDFVGELPELGEEHEAVVKQSRSSYTLTRGELKKGIARAILSFSFRASHDRGKMPNSYKYSPTSQSVGFEVERLKTFYKITVKQLKA